MRINKRIYLLMVCSFFTVTSIAQNCASLDFIIIIDNDIAITNIASIEITSIIDNGETLTYKPYYHPGHLRLDSTEINNLFASNIEQTILRFDYYLYDRKNTIKQYEIEIKKEWFLDYYFILRIYNLDKRKYRKKYKRLSKDRNYTFEVDTPSHSMLRGQ